jgi:hypothetical protein
MRRIPWGRLRVLAAAGALGACAETTAPPADPDVVLGEPLGVLGTTLDLTWIPGTRLVAFRAAATDSTTCAVRTLDVDSGRVATLDADCASLNFSSAGPLRGLAASYDGSLVAWQIGVTGSGPLGAAVRAAAGGAPAAEYHRASRLWPAVAVSRDGHSVAFAWSLNDTLVVHDVVTGADARVAAARPIAFSPTGLELAYLVGLGSVRRRTIGDSTERAVSLALIPGDALGPMYWDVTGLWAMVDRLDRGVRLRNTDTGAEVLAVPFDFGRLLRFPAWSPDGRRFAFWSEYCEQAPLFAPCTVESTSLIVVDRDTGARTVAARATEPGGPIALSPDGTEVVYAVGGRYYRAAVGFQALTQAASRR